ncbi:hypothetical protein ACFFNY_05740 [Paenibacillus hodogayensis]|uniref:Uncharacterized protein n=1 Tax=Paenibacillus hodogayensis TaxID=279208 RepID=A0ABV5VS26_9BACL
MEKYEADQSERKWRRPLLIVLLAAAAIAGLTAWLFGSQGYSGAQRDNESTVSVPMAEATEGGNGPLDAPKGQVTIVAVPGWSFLDWTEEALREQPALSDLIRRAAIGAMNVRTPEKGLEDSYATLGAGAPAISGSGYIARNTGKASGSGDGNKEPGTEAEALYRRMTGLAPDGAEVVVPEIAAIRRRNHIRSQHVRPGLLGELLRSYGLLTGVYGNSDMGEQRKRFAALMVMDEQGIVPRGNVSGSMVTADEGSAFSTRVNADELLRARDGFPARSVLLLEWGDLLRLEGEDSVYDPEHALRKRREALRELDRFIGQLRQRQEGGDRLWIVSPYVGARASREKWQLAPVVYAGPDLAGGALLTSPSTRRPGIVTASDFAPTVLAGFGIGVPAEVTGRPVRMIRKTEAWIFLHRELSFIREVYRIRPKVLVPFVSVEAAALLAALIVVWARLGKAVRWIEVLLLALLTAPLSLLAVGWLNRFHPLSGGKQAALFVAVAVLAAGLLMIRRSALSSAYLISAITALAVLLDGLLGAEGMKRSVLGYDPVIGARYYGIGNEYMGVIVGAAAFAFAAFMERAEVRPTDGEATRVVVAAAASQRRVTLRVSVVAAVGFAGVTLYLAAPGLGTNAGGAITAAVAFGLVWLRCRSQAEGTKLNVRRLMLVCLGLIALAFALLWLLNAAIPAEEGSQSHIGRAMNTLSQGRMDLIAAIVVRKLQMNLHLINVSVWTKVLAAGLIVMTVAVVRPRGALRRWQALYPHYMSGFLAIAVGSVVALVFNDSGIVAAATMIVYAAAPMLLLRFQEESSSHSS